MPLHPAHLFRSALPLVALLLIALVFWPALQGGFIFDDYPIFAENPAIHVTGWHWQDWLRVWTWSHSNIQRPLAMLSYAFNYALGGNTWWFKATNLALHALNAVLLMLLTQRFLFAGWAVKAQDADTAALRQTSGYWALGVATLWAIHPLHVSTVMYVVQRMELLGFLFVLLSLLAYWRGRQQQTKGRPAWPWLMLCALLSVVGYFAKETALLVPGYTLLLELTLLHFAAQSRATRRALKAAYATGAALAALAAVLYLLPHYTADALYAGRGYTAWQRQLSQLRVLPLYIGWILLPLPKLLHFYYDNYPVSQDLFQPISTLLGGLLLLSLMALAILLRKLRPLFALGIGWFFVAHSLTSSPIPLELVFEHRNYPALFGILLALADLLYVATRRTERAVLASIMVILVVYFGSLTFIRASIWGDRLLLTNTLAEDNPGSARAAYDLARRYMFMAGNNPGNPLYALSIKELRRAAGLPVASPMAEEALILVNADHHDQKDIQALWASFLDKLQNHPLGPEAYAALDQLTTERLRGNQDIDAQQLARAYEITIRRNPTRESLHSSYAELAGAVLHDHELAIRHWRQALSLDTNVGGYSRRLAAYLLESQRYQEALAVVTQAWQLQPALRNDATLIALQKQSAQNVAAAQSAGESPPSVPEPNVGKPIEPKAIPMR
ncbi:hypothetical protein [Dyella sp. C9]|uniref:hypothetical protein n=1 Tax=Dyella sp. C9 TaxID=2202154 RepID=UPI000DF008B0|nr:hypothetical protein [Dyella sp. C9]